ncbi:MAG: hypothetical protein M3409_11410, partial [Gemmatimonadota bacterium]|nr:hypothetical protein [Gemmatimonadota bacterium]
MPDSVSTLSERPSAAGPPSPGGEPGMTTGTQRAGIAAQGRSGGLGQRLRDYVTLTKPRIISLLLV